MGADRSAASVSKERTGGRLLVETLRMHGVQRIFCVPGESYLDVLDALHDVPEMQLVVSKHEGGAACMAEADGKLTGKPGICMVTRGPGATHASIGVHIAQQDSTPMLMFIGQIARGDTGRDTFQEIDYEKMYGAVAKWAVQINDPDRIPEIVARAWRVAVSGRPGPVVIALPEDMLEQKTVAAPCAATAPVLPEVPAAAIDDVTAMLQSATAPLVIVGGPNWSADARAALRRFAETWQLPVACSFRRQDLMDNDLPQYIGHLSLGMNPALAKRVREADLVLAIGARLTDTATDGYQLLAPPRPAQKLIHIHQDGNELGRVYQADLAIQSTPEAALHKLAQTRPAGVPAWSTLTGQNRREFDSFVSGEQLTPPTGGVDLTYAIKHLSEVMPSDAIITNGAGNYSVWLHRFYRFRASQTQLAPVCGSMGYGLPAAIAASLRHPEREVVAVTGDGCFMMYPQELATAVAYGARLIVLIANNGMYGTIRMHQERKYPDRVIGTELQGPDYVALARAFGAHAELVERNEQFAPALQRARDSGKVAVIELRTDPLQLTPQMRLAA